MFRMLLAGLLFWMASQCFAQTVAQLKPGVRSVSLWEAMSVWEDRSGLASFERVSALPETAFRPLRQPFSAGYSRSAFWFRFRLSALPAASCDWLLDIQPMYLHDLQLFEARKNAPPLIQRMGSRVPFASRSHPYRGFLFDIRLQGVQTKTFYLRMQTHTTSMLIPVLESSDSFLNRLQLETLLQGMYFGVLAIMLLHALIYWGWLQEKFYLAFLGQLLALLLMGLGYGGLISQYLLPARQDWASGLAPLGNCCYVFCTQMFFILFLDIRSFSIWLYRWWLSLAGFALLVALSITVDRYVDFAPWLSLGSLITIPLGLALSWRAWRDGKVGSLPVLIGCLVYGVIISGNLLAVLGWAPADYVLIYGWQYSALIFMLFLQHAVLGRLRHYQTQHQAARRQAELAEQAGAREKAKRLQQKEFLSLMSHELRTPLAVIDSAVQVLEYTRPVADPHVAVRYERIRRAVRQLGVLTENALERARSDDCGFCLKREFLRLDEWVKETVQALPGSAHRVRLPALPEVRLTGDSGMLKVMLDNVVRNALKYSPPESEVVLHADVLDADGRLSLRVGNLCLSPPADLTSRAFDRHWRGGGETGASGLGLGLSLVKSIAEEHGGRCYCQVRGSHVEFVIELPVVEQHG